MNLLTWKLDLLRQMPYVAVALPLVLAALLGASGGSGRRSAPWIALPGPLAVGAVGVAGLLGEGSRGSLAWIRAGAASIDLTWRLDALAAVMLTVVGVVAACVMVFSVGYLHGERGLVRYYAFLSLFTAAMAGLVLADDLVTLFLSWELVGVCSYLLIGFWYEKPEAAEAARTAFLVTRVGDAAMLLGMGVLWAQTGSLRLDDVFTGAAGPVATLAALALLAGAVGKSAQFPLHLWLPDAMEGPTPVSALIHAATMVAAGVFLVARTWPLFEAAPAARMVALVLGCVTALGAATIALPQNDIKKVLAYSTISQLGFMFAALGVGAWTVALFHLVTHAAFKALLFLASGSVIHGSGTQDLRGMGGLWRRMPVTAGVWLVGSLALAGVPPLAGFFSKDEVVASVLHSSWIAGVALLAASTLTAAYMARATHLAFFGTPRGERAAHESPASMLGPMLVLAALAVVLGAVGGPLAGLLGHEAESIDLTVAAVAVALAAIGGVAGWLPWARDPGAEAAFPPWLERAWGHMRGGYGYDPALRRAIVRPLTALSAFAYAFLDRLAIDGLVEGAARGAQRAGAVFARLQTGDGQFYAGLAAAGIVALLALVAGTVR